jgi:hypothetical protein
MSDAAGWQMAHYCTELTAAVVHGIFSTINTGFQFLRDPLH